MAPVTRIHEGPFLSVHQWFLLGASMWATLLVAGLFLPWPLNMYANAGAIAISLRHHLKSRASNRKRARLENERKAFELLDYELPGGTTQVPPRPTSIPSGGRLISK